MDHGSPSWRNGANLIAFMLFAGHACFEFVPAVSSLRITAVRTALTIAFGVLQKRTCCSNVRIWKKIDEQICYWASQSWCPFASPVVVLPTNYCSITSVSARLALVSVRLGSVSVRSVSVNVRLAWMCARLVSK